jgi:N-acetylglucosamine-6-sulfatase
MFALRGDRYKYITYYGLWDADELYDLQNNPGETHNLLYDPAHQKLAKQMENKLYKKMGELGGMELPLNQPAGGINNKRLRSRGGNHASDFPSPLVVDEPINHDAN